MKRWAHREFETFKDDDGTPLVRVSLGGRRGKHAILEEKVFLDLIGMGLSFAWNLSPEGQVQAYSGKASGKKVGVARVLLNAQPKDVVQYLDGDSRNLRSNNLALVKGKGWSTREDRALI